MTTETTTDPTELIPSYVARCPECGGLWAAVVAEPDKPQRWASTVTGWTRWKSRTPRISLETVGDVRRSKFCHAGLCKPGPHMEAAS